MAREFRVSAGGFTVAGATTLVAVNPAAAANFNLEFLRFWIGQSANATSAQQRIQLLEKASVFPTLTSQAPVSLKRADPNASIIVGATTGAIGTSGINASAEGAGAAVVLHDDSFNVLNGYLHVPTPPETHIAPAGLGKATNLYFPVAPGTLTNWAAGCIYREI